MDADDDAPADTHPLVVRYGVHTSALVRRQPVALVGSEALPDSLLTTLTTAPQIDRRLKHLGASYLQAIRAVRPAMFDGAVLNMVECSAQSITAAPGSYFDMITTCDALATEYSAAAAHGSTDVVALPIRERSDVLAVDPLRFGYGRAAAIGLSVVVTAPTRSGRVVFVGRRRPDLATDPNRLHVVPSGMMEPSRTGSPILEAVQRELAEELGISLTVESLHHRMVMLGIVHDLLRLRPEICLRLDLDMDEASARDRSTAQSEYSAVEELPLAGLADFLISAGSTALTPAGAGALALAVAQETR